MKKHSLAELESLIPSLSRAYYLGNPQVSDTEFDTLIEELRSLDPDNYILSSVGWGGMDQGFSHRYKTPHIGELVEGISDKVKYPTVLKDHYLEITPKIDGGSVCLYYRDGEPMALITRGNGKEGLNVLHKFVDRFPSLPAPYNTGLICFRGEAYTPKSLFKELESKGVPSPRNYANGILSRDSGMEDPDLKYVQFVFYQIRIFNTDIQGYNKNEILAIIKQCGLPVVMGILLNILDVCPTPDELKTYYERFQQYDWPTDGIVMTASIMTREQDYGYAVTENTTAYKFESESVETMVTKVVWNHGSSGRTNPVVYFEPVFLAGAKIQKATGFNAGFIHDNGIDKGALIKVTRSNEVIPYIQEVIDPVDDVILPSVCQICGTVLEFDGITLYCPNKECANKRIEQCNRILTLEDIPLGLGGKGGVNIQAIIETVCESPSLYDMIDFILNKDWSSLNNVLSPHYLELAKTHFDNLYIHLKSGITADEFWYIIHLPSISKSNAKKLPFPITDDDYSQYRLTPSFLKTLMDYSEYISDVIRFLEDRGIKIAKSQQEVNEDLIPVCYTGATDKFKTRKEFFGFYANRVKEVSIKSAEYLICNKPSSSSKYKYASDNNIPIVTEAEFIEILNQN